MSAPVFLSEASLASVQPGTVVEIHGPEAHHAIGVQRLRAGELVEIVDGRGTRARGSVDAKSTRERLAVSVHEVLHERASSTAITVVQALPKGDRGERAVELLTEVGVDAVIPWHSDHTITEWKGERGAKAHAKWTSTAHAAAKQSRRSFLPVIHPLHSTDALLSTLPPNVFALDEQADQRAADEWQRLEHPGEVWLIVGPEGGLSDRERTRFDQAGVRRIRLDLPVMRTSTAGAAALVALRTMLGEV